MSRAEGERSLEAIRELSGIFRAMPDWSCSKCGWEGPEPDKDTLVIRGGIGTIQLDDGSADILFNSGEIAILRCPECATSTELDKPLLDQ